MRELIKNIGKKITPKSIEPIVRKFYRKAFNFVKYGESDFFTAINFENITACSRRCIYCPNSIYERGLLKNKKLMDEKVFFKLIDELAEIKFSGMMRPVFYGEPLLDDRLESWIRHMRIKLPSAKIHIFTNGDFLNLETYKKLVNAGTDLFILSNHNSIGVSQTTKELLSNFHPAKYSGGYYNDTAYALGNDLPRIIYKEPGIGNKKLYNRGGLLKNIKPTKITSLKCALPADEINIDYAGNVILCCNDYLSSVKFGNIDNESLMNIWRKKSYKIIRNNLKRGQLDLEICRKCKGM